jgi:hypothetical protein
VANADAIVLAEAVEQLNALLEHAIPGIAMRVLELLILIKLPFLKQGDRRVLAEEIGVQSAFKGAPEEHGCPNVFLLPAIQITMTVAPRARQILADLGIAVDHQPTSDSGGSSAAVGESSFQRLSDARFGPVTIGLEISPTGSKDHLIDGTCHHASDRLYGAML